MAKNGQAKVLSNEELGAVRDEIDTIVTLIGVPRSYR